MEFKGTVIAVLEAKEGISKTTGNPWKTQEFVLENTDSQYPKKLCFSVFGDDKIKEFSLKVGDVVTAHLNIDAKEWNGKWFNSIQAWKVQRDAPHPNAQPQPTQQKTDGLPF